MIGVNKKEGESVNALIFRFSKKVRRSGITQEVRRRRFRARPQSKLKKRVSALHRLKKSAEPRPVYKPPAAR
ncbi:MAG: 30S ribosomal protein S21 [Patescibacteria group bacterium]